MQASLRKLARALAADPFAGTFVELARVPHATRQAWQRRLGRLTNLYKADLADAWRALYTVGSDGAARLVLVIEVVDHKRYDRMLGYRTS